MATGQFAGQVVKTIRPSHTPSEVGDYAKREWVAADAGKVLAKQVGGTCEVAGGRGVDYFDVMAFPIHLAATDRLRASISEGVEIGDGEPEGRVGVDGEPQRRGGQARVGGALCLPVPRSSPPLCGDHAAVDVNRRPGSGQVVMVAGVLVTHWLHECKVARVR